METSDHFKNGATPKSHTSRVFKIQKNEEDNSTNISHYWHNDK